MLLLSLLYLIFLGTAEYQSIVDTIMTNFVACDFNFSSMTFLSKNHEKNILIFQLFCCHTVHLNFTRSSFFTSARKMLSFTSVSCSFFNVLFRQNNNYISTINFMGPFKLDIA